MIDSVRHMSLRVALAVLLAAISLHALLPGEPFEQGRGSAFSAATVDSAILTNVRQAENARLALSFPPGLFENCAVPCALVVPAIDQIVHTLVPWPQAPPKERLTKRRAQPRAPPSI